MRMAEGSAGWRGVDALLSEEQREMFWRDGFVLVPNLLTQQEGACVCVKYVHQRARVLSAYV